MSTGARSEQNAEYFQAIVPKRSWYINFTGTAMQGPAFYSATDPAAPNSLQLTGTTVISLIATEDCYVLIGANPVVVAPTQSGVAVNGFFLPAGIQEYIGVVPGQLLSVISIGTSGTLYVNEGA